jgi:hypothetical protein
VAAGADGFEIVNCSPKGLRLPSSGRRRVIELAAPADLLVVGASDNHGWGRVTCVWNLTRPGAEGFRANRVLARPVALAQGDAAAWSAPLSQLWLMLRALDWDERISWLTWIALITIYRAVPRRGGDGGGLGILARSLPGIRKAWRDMNDRKASAIEAQRQRRRPRPGGVSQPGAAETRLGKDIPKRTGPPHAEPQS